MSDYEKRLELPSILAPLKRVPEAVAAERLAAEDDVAIKHWLRLKHEVVRTLTAQREELRA